MAMAEVTGSRPEKIAVANVQRFLVSVLRSYRRINSTRHARHHLHEQLKKIRVMTSQGKKVSIGRELHLLDEKISDLVVKESGITSKKERVEHQIEHMLERLVLVEKRLQKVPHLDVQREIDSLRKKIHDERELPSVRRRLEYLERVLAPLVSEHVSGQLSELREDVHELLKVKKERAQRIHALEQKIRFRVESRSARKEELVKMMEKLEHHIATLKRSKKASAVSTNIATLEKKIATLKEKLACHPLISEEKVISETQKQDEWSMRAEKAPVFEQTPPTPQRQIAITPSIPLTAPPATAYLPLPERKYKIPPLSPSAIPPLPPRKSQQENQVDVSMLLDSSKTEEMPDLSFDLPLPPPPPPKSGAGLFGGIKKLMKS